MHNGSGLLTVLSPQYQAGSSKPAGFLAHAVGGCVTFQNAMGIIQWLPHGETPTLFPWLRTFKGQLHLAVWHWACQVLLGDCVRWYTRLHGCPHHVALLDSGMTA